MLFVEFKDVLNFLFERAKRDAPGLTHEQFAERYVISRPVMTQMLNGSYTPDPKTILKILKFENYDLADCIDLPEMRMARDKRLRHVEELLKRNDSQAELLGNFIDYLLWQSAQQAGHHPKTTESAGTRAPPTGRKTRRAM